MVVENPLSCLIPCSAFHLPNSYATPGAEYPLPRITLHNPTSTTSLSPRGSARPDRIHLSHALSNRRPARSGGQGYTGVRASGWTGTSSAVALTGSAPSTSGLQDLECGQYARHVAAHPSLRDGTLISGEKVPTAWVCCRKGGRSAGPVRSASGGRLRVLDEGTARAGVRCFEMLV